jgi:hypothetical protein
MKQIASNVYTDQNSFFYFNMKYFSHFIYTVFITEDPEPEFKLLRSPETDSKESISPAYVAWRPERQTSLSYPPARLHRLAESISWNQFLGSLEV